ncbi:techylectin-5B-like [Anopheles marshallii]|uniref:techylectin-5B-like n=1 Tax=Anopheles marshallii TaxID=1521116 RepID=UPI00237B6142|nr:techylectin-5B-like [Anopheles marshallii]
MPRVAVLLTFTLILNVVSHAQCELNTSIVSASSSGFAYEMVMAKLQLLENQLIETNLETEEKIIIVSSKMDNLIKTVENLSWIVQQAGETVNQLGLSGKHIGQNLTVIQRDLTNVLAEQKLLVTNNQLREYLTHRFCNASNMPLVKEQRSSRYKSCSKIPFPVSGVYTIQPEKLFKEPITVLCDQEYESGGWTVIQHRFDGSTNFYRSWQEYKNGFGNLDGEFWLGLDRIYHLTVSGAHELVILLEDFDGNKTYAKYDQFEIGNENQKYAITKLGEYSGTAGDSMHNAKDMKFSTFDSDNDVWNDNCAVAYSGAWWYGACHKSNLNGKYLRGETKQTAMGMMWLTFRGHDYALKASKMMIRSTVK